MVHGKRRSPEHLPIFTAQEKRSLHGEHFSDAVLEGVDLVGADLRECSFESVSLRAASLVEADLFGAQFVNCDLRDADFTGAHLGRNRFVGTWLTGARGLSDAQQNQIRAQGGRFLEPITGGSEED